jgi:hypothetical protein
MGPYAIVGETFTASTTVYNPITDSTTGILPAGSYLVIWSASVKPSNSNIWEYGLFIGSANTNAAIQPGSKRYSGGSSTVVSISCQAIVTLTVADTIAAKARRESSNTVIIYDRHLVAIRIG